MFPCSTHGMCIRIHQTQRMVQVPFDVFMAAKPLNAILQQNGLPTTLNFITRSRDNTESLILAEDMQSQHCLKVVQVLNRQELQNDMTFSNLTGNQREEKKNVSLSLR